MPREEPFDQFPDVDYSLSRTPGKKPVSGHGITKEMAFMIKHKPRVRRDGTLSFKRQRTGTERYARDYLALIPDHFYACVGDYDFHLRTAPVTATAAASSANGGDSSEALRTACISNGRRRVETLLNYFAKSTASKSKGGGDWRLKYKLDTKVFVATLVLYMCEPPDPATGYKDMVSESNGRKANKLVDALSAKNALSSITADHRLVKLECQMYKVYYTYLRTTG